MIEKQLERIAVALEVIAGAVEKQADPMLDVKPEIESAPELPPEPVKKKTTKKKAVKKQEDKAPEPKKEDFVGSGDLFDAPEEDVKEVTEDQLRQEVKATLDIIGRGDVLDVLKSFGYTDKPSDIKKNEWGAVIRALRAAISQGGK